jgi:hypothetical protein
LEREILDPKPAPRSVLEDHLTCGFALAAVASGFSSPNEHVPPSIDGLDDTLGEQDGAHGVHHSGAKDGVGEDGAAAGSEGGNAPAWDVAVDGLH